MFRYTEGGLDTFTRRLAAPSAFGATILVFVKAKASGASMVSRMAKTEARYDLLLVLAVDQVAT